VFILYNTNHGMYCFLFIFITQMSSIYQDVCYLSTCTTDGNWIPPPFFPSDVMLWSIWLILVCHVLYGGYRQYLSRTVFRRLINKRWRQSELMDGPCSVNTRNINSRTMYVYTVHYDSRLFLQWFFMPSPLCRGI